MPLFSHTNRRSPKAGNESEVGKLDYRIGNPNHGQGVYLTGAEQPIATEGQVVTSEFMLGTTTTAYTAGDAVGQIIEIPAARSPGRGGVIETVVFMENTTQAISLTLWLWRQRPATETADNAAFAYSDAIMRETIGFIPITSYATTSPTNNRVAVARGVGLAYQCGVNDSLIYGQLQTDGTPTYELNGCKLLVSTILE